MNGYSIYTLWGEPTWGVEKEPVQVAVAVDFFEQRIWRVVVERENEHGFVVQRDVTQGLTIGEALEQKKNLMQVYRGDCYVSRDDLYFYPPGLAEGRTDIYLDAGNEKSHASKGG